MNGDGGTHAHKTSALVVRQKKTLTYRNALWLDEPDVSNQDVARSLVITLERTTLKAEVGIIVFSLRFVLKRRSSSDDMVKQVFNCLISQIKPSSDGSVLYKL